MKKKTKVIFIITIIILACLALGVWYINKFVLPVKIKALVVNLLKEKTGHDVTIGRISYLPLSRFYLKEVTFYDKRTPQNPLVNIKGLSFSFQVWPFLKDRRVIANLSLNDLTCGKISISGATSSSLKQRPFPAPRPLLKNLDGTIKFTNFSIQTEALPLKIEGITGAVSFQDNIVRLTETFLKYEKIVYSIEGALTDLDKEEPKGTLLLSSDLLKSEGEFTLKDNYIKIERLEGELLDTTFNIIGDIKNFASPSLNLYCEARTDLADLKKLFPKSKYILDSLKPAGFCDAALFFNGELNNLKSSEASIKLSSPKVFLHGLALDDLYLDLRMKDGIVETHRFDLRPYLGLLNGSFALDLNQQDRPYSANFALKDGNLAKFSSDMNFGKEDISGLISSRFFLKGSLRSTDTLHGNGWITVTNGHLWEWSLLSGVTNVLGLPGLRSVVFREAAGNFIIENRRISTEDLTFYSEEANLNASGFLDFDGNIDISMRTNVTQDIARGSSDIARIANLIISEAGNYMSNIRITGTLEEPEYKLTAKPIQEILKQDIFKRELKGILQDIIR